MIPKSSTLRVARPTDHLKAISDQYLRGLGFRIISEFQDHDGFSGTIIGHDIHPYHLEFTHHAGTTVGSAPTKDNLLIFYVPDRAQWLTVCESMQTAGFKAVTSYNPYWARLGRTFEDLDGYRVVIQNA